MGVPKTSKYGIRVVISAPSKQMVDITRKMRLEIFCNGIYFLKIVSGNKVMNKKIVIVGN